MNAITPLVKQMTSQVSREITKRNKRGMDVDEFVALMNHFRETFMSLFARRSLNPEIPKEFIRDVTHELLVTREPIRTVLQRRERKCILTASKLTGSVKIDEEVSNG